MHFRCGWPSPCIQGFMKPPSTDTLFTFPSGVNACSPLSITPSSVLFVLFLRVTAWDPFAHCLLSPKATCPDVLPPGTLEHAAHALESLDVDTSCGASRQISVLSFSQLLWGPSRPKKKHFSMTKTIYSGSWSFCCPDLYIRIKVICPFKLHYQKLLGTDVINIFKRHFYPTLVIILHMYSQF